MFSVGILGLGKIAAGYGSPDDVAPYCHVGGIRRSRQVRLAAVADTAEPARRAFREKWGACFPDTRYHNSLDAMLAAEPLDIVAICIRGPHHFEAVRQTLAARPRVIFLEKPPTCSLDEMDRMLAEARAAGTAVTVSYSRHWAPHILRLEQLVKQGLIGDVRTVVAFCGHSILSFASHTTDLLCQFAGYDAVGVSAQGGGQQEVPPGYESEPELAGMLVEFASGITGIQVGADGEHGGMYCEIVGTEGRARAGMYIPPFACTRKGEPIDLTTLDMPPNASVFQMAYDQIAAFLHGGPRPACTDGDFVMVHEIGFAAIESLIRKERIALPNVHRTRRIFANG